MHATNLREVGGAVMLAVPPTLLALLDLKAGAKVDIGVEAGRLVVVPRTRPTYTLEELLAECARSAPDRAWLDSPPAGKELP